MKKIYVDKRVAFLRNIRFNLQGVPRAFDILFHPAVNKRVSFLKPLDTMF